MRELKFRAFDQRNNKMLDSTSECASLFGNEISIDGSRHGNIVLMQYTGLKDKNGKEIYEGDIVRWDDGSSSKYWRIAEVFYNNLLAEYDYKIIGCINCHLNKGYVFGSNFMYRNGKNLEIIGNIHENPELL